MNDLTNIVVVSFDEQSKAFQAYSELKGLNTLGQVEVLSGGVVQRDDDGWLRIPEGSNPDSGLRMAGGSMIGLLVGVLGGPIGMLLGWGTGALVGGAVEARRADQGDELLRAVSQAIPAGSTTVMAEVVEPSTAVVDRLMSGLGGTVVRRPASDVLAEMEAAEDASEDAEKEARKAQRKAKKADHEEKYEERKAKFQEKFARRRDKTADSSK